jgi:hypothetical protein
MNKPRRKSPTKRKSVANKFETTPERKEVTDANRARDRNTAPTIEVRGDNLVFVSPDEITGDLQLMETLGSPDAKFQSGLIWQLANAGSQGSGLDENSINFMLSMVNGIGPQDEVEAMLAVQMAAVHSATMSSARRLNQADNIMQADSAERALTKLARTFTTQMEALKRYRVGGEQKITVQHVNVEDGGQAIVGNVGGGLSKKSEPTP